MRDDHERANLGAANGLFLRYPIANTLIASDNDPMVVTPRVSAIQAQWRPAVNGHRELSF